MASAGGGDESAPSPADASLKRKAEEVVWTPPPPERSEAPAEAPAGGASGAADGGLEEGQWVCDRCTMINTTKKKCSMCGKGRPKTPKA